MGETFSMKGERFFIVSLPAPANFYPGNYPFLTLDSIPTLLSDIKN
jgi:hypothetical protein